MTKEVEWKMGSKNRKISVERLKKQERRSLGIANWKSICSAGGPRVIEIKITSWARRERRRRTNPPEILDGWINQDRRGAPL